MTPYLFDRELTNRDIFQERCRSMSYQTSIHFDPTTLLIIKQEVDSSIKQVEAAVSSLVEDQSLPFGIDDALNQFEQCAQVLALIDMPSLAQIAQYSAELMSKVMANPQNIQTQQVIALTEGTTMLKRYMEFICLREVEVPQFLLDTLNHLELALGKPLSNEGQAIEPLLTELIPQFTFHDVPALEKSDYVHRLYKLCLSRLLKQTETELDIQGLKLVGTYLAHSAVQSSSTQYWNLVNVALSHIDDLILSNPRLRVLIRIESNIGKFFAQPEQFKESISDLADILTLCISQEDQTAHYIREQLNIADDHLTDTQLQVFSRHLYGPEFDTIHTVSQLINDEMTQIRHEIEHNYQNMSAEKTSEIQSKLFDLANIFKVLNLHDAYAELTQQATLLNDSRVLADENYAQQLMNSLLSATNSIGILERHYTSSRLQLKVNNMHISLDRLDEAHDALLNETKTLIDLTSKTLVQYLQHQDAMSLEVVPAQMNEVAGALLFLGVKDGSQAIRTAADFIQKNFESNQPLNSSQVNLLLDPLASADMLIENLKTKQPVLQSMFNIALSSSQKLQSVA